ncbi:chemotactic sensor histidine kinase CheA [Candidatus Nitrososphaera gargensis Ga9.2]|uniref:Chemotaxis protein CheA n=2 Tax=Candidatus Nitrososphaera gargensis TaxID=497727 RepID=K0IDX7_NITGG|nr:chemotactic sensor histidine kinase CheA [Candidatus Nitrososphaera gargensis Ga9.2]
MARWKVKERGKECSSMSDDFSKYREMFVQEAIEHIQSLNNAMLQLEQDPHSKEHLDSAFRAAHTLKGMAATMGYEQIRQVCKTIEELFDRLRKREVRLTTGVADFLFKSFDVLDKMVNDENKIINMEEFMQEFQKVTSGSENASGQQGYDLSSPNASAAAANGMIIPAAEQSGISEETGNNQSHTKTQTIRVKMDDLDSLVDLVGEIMIAKMRLEQVLSDSQQAGKPRQVLRNLDRLINNLQNHTMKIRLVPIEQIFDRFPRMVRDLSNSQGKEVRLEMEGTGIELDRTVLDAIRDPLLHMLRNSVDHGIELPEEREKMGKPRHGTIKLKASRLGDKVLIEVSDDGRGIDLEKVKEKAIEKHIINRQEAEAMTTEDIVDLLGSPGLSTAQKVTDVSGRGVGLNVVINKIESVGGTVRIKTEKNHGTTFTMTIPLSLAIIGGLLVKIGNEKYVIQISNVLSTIQIDQDELRRIHGKPVVMFREQVVPLVYGAEVLNVPQTPAQDSHCKMTVIIVEKGGKPLGLVVDSFESKQDIVLKHIDRIGYNSSNVPTDATILSDGRVALILDLTQLEEKKT